MILTEFDLQNYMMNLKKIQSVAPQMWLPGEKSTIQMLHGQLLLAGLALQILTWGGLVPPHRGGTHGGGQGSDGGGLARNSRQNSEVS